MFKVYNGGNQTGPLFIYLNTETNARSVNKEK